MTLVRPWALAGFSGSGKSALAPLVAVASGRRAVDLDELIGAERIAALLATSEAGLRSLEAGMLADLARGGSEIVVALGGGALEGAASRAILAQSFVVAWLDVPLATCLERCAAQGHGARPLLEAALRLGSDEIERFHERRVLAARLARVRVDASRSPDRVARELLCLLQDAEQDFDAGRDLSR